MPSSSRDRQVRQNAGSHTNRLDQTSDFRRPSSGADSKRGSNRNLNAILDDRHDFVGIPPATSFVRRTPPPRHNCRIPRLPHRTSHLRKIDNPVADHSPIETDIPRICQPIADMKRTDSLAGAGDLDIDFRVPKRRSTYRPRYRRCLRQPTRRTQSFCEPQAAQHGPRRTKHRMKWLEREFDAALTRVRNQFRHRVRTRADAPTPCPCRRRPALPK